MIRGYAAPHLAVHDRVHSEIIDMKSYIHPIDDAPSIASNRLQMNLAIDDPFAFNLAWLKSNGFVCVPVESGMHFTDQDAKLIADALASSGNHFLNAVLTESLDNTVINYWVDASTEGLMAFSDACGSLNYLLATPNRNLYILCTTSDYFLVAGADSLVSICVGGDIPLARKAFREYSLDPAWPSQERQILTDTGNRYDCQ